MKIFWPLCLALAAVVALHAQTNPPATEPTAAASADTASRVRPPTQIHSSSGEFNLRSNVFVYHGDVRIDDPQMKLTCDLLTIAAPKLTEGKYNQAVADGNVVIDWFDEQGQINHAVSDHAVYEYSITNAVTNATVTLTGNASVTNAQGSITGEPIIWDRIHDNIRYFGGGRTTIRQTGTNMPNLFDAFGTGKTNAVKPKPGGVPK